MCERDVRRTVTIGRPIAACLAIALAHVLLAGPARAQTTAPDALLDVPYIAQPPDLCGGAAVAMVLRYWGDARATAEDFAPLVDRAAHGIHTDTLASAVADRGWNALAGNATSDVDSLDVELRRGRPIIVLIEDRAQAYHYVVVLARTKDAVIVHDPARAPFRVFDAADFEQRWRAAGAWRLVIVPGTRSSTLEPRGTANRAPDAASRRTTAPSTVPAGARQAGPDAACAPLVDQGIALAHDGDLDTAERTLVAAAALCPASPDPWRELAGLKLLQGKWPDVVTFATHAVEIAPGDSHAWQLLATARFVGDDELGALRAWNRRGEPRIASIDVLGVERTRHPVVTDLMGLAPGDLLTAEAFSVAARRVQQLPAARAIALRYRPAEDGDVTLHAVVDERSMVPGGVMEWGGIGARAILKDEVRIDLASLTGSGEVWTGAWRWQPNRPRVAFGLALPSPGRLPGVVTVEAFWEEQTYSLTGSTDASALVRQPRRRGSVEFSDWVTSRVQWRAGTAMDRIAGTHHVSFDTGVDVRFADDRISAGAASAVWFATAGGRKFAVHDVSIAWRNERRSAPAWSAVTGLAAATAASPFAVWPSAGTGITGRGALLRAHKLHEHGILTSDQFGRRLAYFSIEHQRPLAGTRLGNIAWAAFLDVARAWQGIEMRRSPTQADVGGGVRLGGGSGRVRLDLAYGLRDRGWALSAGWITEWPGR